MATALVAATRALEHLGVNFGVLSSSESANILIWHHPF
jgi:hypothetical protein